MQNSKRAAPGRHSLRGRLSCGTPNPVDSHFGQRLRERRLLAGMNQAELGKAVGLTPQQVQKYESAVNRAVASLLWNFSRALDCPVAFFFEGMTAVTRASSPRRLMEGENLSALAEVRSADRRSERETLNLARAYRAIRQESTRITLLGLLPDLAASPDEAKEPPAPAAIRGQRERFSRERSR
jgi:transcriptional regulator with XRE-family HTH domain